MNETQKIRNGIEVFHHVFEGEEWYTDSPSPYAKGAREFKPIGDPDGLWREVTGDPRSKGSLYEYWQGYGIMVKAER